MQSVCVKQQPLSVVFMGEVANFLTFVSQGEAVFVRMQGIFERPF